MINFLLVRRLWNYCRYYGLRRTLIKIFALIREVKWYLENRSAPVVLLNYRYDLGGVDRDLDKPLVESLGFTASGMDRKLHQWPYEYALPFIGGGYRVLEIGCNWGYGTEILAERAGFVAAFDVNCEAVKQARELYGGGNIGFFVHDAGQPFPFADETFDLVFSSEVIEHIAAQECLLRESARVLRKKGTLALKTPNIHFDPRYHKLNPFHLHVFTYGELRRALGDYFAEVKIHTYDLEFSYQVHIRPRLESLHHEDRPDCFYLPNCAIVEGQIRRRIDELHSDKVPSQYFLAICRKC